MQVVIIALMCAINLILWLVFFIKFKKLFTTEDEIQKTREQYELLITDLNRNTLSHIDMIDMKIEELKSVIDIADRRLSTIQNEQEFIQNRNSVINSKPVKTTPKKNSKVTNIASQVIDQDAAYEVTVSKKGRRKNQAESFDDENSTQKKKSRTTITVDMNGNAYGEVPVVSPKIYRLENPIQAKKSFHSQVKSLYDQGFTVDQISQKLNKSTTEVQLVIDML